MFHAILAQYIITSFSESFRIKTLVSENLNPFVSRILNFALSKLKDMTAICFRIRDSLYVLLEGTCSLVTHHPTVFKCEFVNHRQGSSTLRSWCAGKYICIDLRSKCSVCSISSRIQHKGQKELYSLFLRTRRNYTLFGSVKFLSFFFNNCGESKDSCEQCFD